jgi:hypothetical protein
MVNTLRVTSVAAVVLAVLVLASVLGPKQLVNLGMKRDARLDSILNDPNASARSREGATAKASPGADQTPMLVKQAQDFANILKPKVEKLPSTPSGAGTRPPPIIPATSSAKFTLVGLSYSATRPEESFAYIKMADNTCQWVRKGDEIGHTTIREIRPSSIVCSDGNRDSEMTVVAPPDTANLLETGAAAAGNGNQNATLRDRSRSQAPTRLNQSNDEALSRIADKIGQFQQTASDGDPNSMFRQRAAIMSEMVSQLRSPQEQPPSPAARGGIDHGSNDGRDTNPSARQLPYGRPLTSPQPKGN